MHIEWAEIVNVFNSHVVHVYMKSPWNGHHSNVKSLSTQLLLYPCMFCKEVSEA